ncbi:MAG TPA: LysR family transcriptional regulator [Bacillota bacterium]|nr:LysR family transcriptional regulator [Bacillota bacterium]HPZ89799.1 LysR family transcriptional regulator [Bacillota bacterium]HQE01185.1 LysR family transcriptional regulator [Bacillota bacterium]
MHLDYIRSFCKVVKVKSITRAAREMHLSQPALSLQINCLESRLGAKLLERTNRGVRLTPAGEIVYLHGQRLLKIVEAMEQDLKEMHNPASRSLKISASPYPASYILPVKMLKFTKAHPERHFALNIALVEQVIENLVDGTADIGIISGPPPPGSKSALENEKIDCYCLGYDEIVAVCHKHSPWAGKKYSIEQLPGLPLILLSKSFGCRAAVELGLAQHNILSAQLRIVMEVESCAAVISAVKADAGIGLVPRLACFDIGQLETVEIKGLNIFVPINLLVRSALANTSGVQDLIASLQLGNLSANREVGATDC